MKRCMFLVNGSLDGAILDAFHELSGDSKVDANVYQGMVWRARFGMCVGPIVYDFPDEGDPRIAAQALIGEMSSEGVYKLAREYSPERVAKRIGEGQEVLNDIRLREQEAVTRERYGAEAMF